MADYTIIHQDLIIWEPRFGSAVTAGNPKGNVVATAQTTQVTGQPPALLGDELTWQSRPIQYVDGAYTIPGTAVAEVVKLADDQITKVVDCETRKVILKGTFFSAKLVVQSPAKMPTSGGPVPDPVPVKTGGRGRMVNRNKTVKMT